MIEKVEKATGVVNWFIKLPKNSRYFIGGFAVPLIPAIFVVWFTLGQVKILQKQIDKQDEQIAQLIQREATLRDEHAANIRQIKADEAERLRQNLDLFTALTNMTSKNNERMKVIESQTREVLDKVPGY